MQTIDFNPPLPPGQTVFSDIQSAGQGRQVPITVAVSRSSPNAAGIPDFQPQRVLALAVTVYHLNQGGEFRISVTNLGAQPVAEIQVTWFAHSL